MEGASAPSLDPQNRTIKDGTHSVHCVNSYRLGMLRLFDPER
jgi:hypothetical protein